MYFALNDINIPRALVIVKSFNNRIQIIFAEYQIAGYQVLVCYFVTKSHFLLPCYKLAEQEQLTAQGASGRQVRKGAAGGSQRRGSAAPSLFLRFPAEKADDKGGNVCYTDTRCRFSGQARTQRQIWLYWIRRHVRPEEENILCWN